MLIRITGPNNNKFISSVYRIDRTTQLLRGRQRICPSHAGMPLRLGYHFEINKFRGVINQEVRPFTTAVVPLR
jgi:hypothetical protein